MVPSWKPRDYYFLPVAFSFVHKSLQTIHPNNKLFVTGGFQFNEITHKRNVLRCIVPSSSLLTKLRLCFWGFCFKRKVSLYVSHFMKFQNFKLMMCCFAHSVLFLFWQLSKLKRFSIIRNFSARIEPKNLLNKLWATCVIFMKKTEGQTRKI